MSPFPDRYFLWSLRAAAGLSAAVVVLIFFFLAFESMPALQKVGLAAFLADSWHPTEQRYGLAPMLAGSLLVSIGSVVLAGSFGILSAVFCRFYAPPPIARFYSGIIEILAGIPSVLYGFWGLMVLVPWIGSLQPPGPSLLAGILILALMILPTVALTAYSSLQAVPRTYLEGAAALGMTRWGTVRRVALPAARSGLWTGLVLAAARALGETMAVLMVCGNVVQVPRSLFDPVRTLTANIALEMAYALDEHRSALFVTGLLLLCLVIALMATAQGFRARRTYETSLG